MNFVKTELAAWKKQASQKSVHRVPSGLASGGGFKKMPVAWLSLNYIGIDDLGRTPVASLRALFSSQLHRD